MPTTEDEYRNKQLDKYLDSRDYEVSKCCGDYIVEDTDLCNKCNEHCDAISIGDWNYNQIEQKHEDEKDE